MKDQGAVRLPRTYLKNKNIWCHRKHGDTSYYPHWHEYYEIIFYKNCEGICILNGEEYELGKRTLFFLTPKDVHAIQSKKTPTSGSIVISFTPEIIEERLARDASTGPRVIDDPAKSLENLINQLEIIYSSRRKESHIRLMGEFLLNAILVEILERGILMESEHHNVNPAIEKAIILLSTDVSKNISLAEISEFCHLSPAYFSTLFRQEMGKTYSQYVNHARVEMAKQLLVETKKSILEISLLCGYNTLTHFIKVFRRTTGQTPSKYRDEHFIS